MRLLPMLLGLARSLGRSSDEECSLISYLLSVHSKPQASQVIATEPDPLPQKSNFSTFRSILPRTLSTVFGQSDVAENGDNFQERQPSYRDR